MKGSKTQKIIAFLLLITLTIANFLYVGTGIVIAASENLETQGIKIENTNVSFDAFYEGDVHTKELNMEEGGTITCNIVIENAGVVENATIHIDNPNFKIQTDKVDTTYIKNVNEENNQIELNELTTGEHKIQLPITFEQKDIIPVDYFNKTNTFTFSGEYRINSQKATKIEKSIEVETKWNTEVTTELKSEITKYISLGENGVLLEQVITVSTNNKLPKSEETITSKMFTIAENKPISANVLLNGEKIESTYDQEQGIVTIKRTNSVNENNQISWVGANDTYKIIYIYPNGTPLNGTTQEQQINVATKFYGKEETVNKELTENVEITEKGKLVNTNFETTQETYKGYIQEASSKKTYIEEKVNLQISAQGTTINTVKMGETEFINQLDKTQTIRNSYYEKTLINKEKMVSIFGDTVTLHVENADTSETIKILTASTEADQEGNIVVTYGENVKNVIFKIEDTTKQVGEFTIQNVKYLVGDTGYTKQQIEQFKAIQSAISVTTETIEEKITAQTELKSTVIEAQLTVSPDTVSTASLNKDVTIEGTIYTNDMKYTLCENAKIQIVFPKEVQSVNVHSINLINAQGIEVQKATLVTDSNGNKVINLETIGKKADYTTGAVDGIHILINADMSIDKKAATKQENITFSVQTEKETIERKATLNIKALTNVITTSKIPEYNIDVINNEGNKVAEVELGADSKTIQVENELVNVDESSMKEINILGTLLTDNTTNNMGVTIQNGVSVEGIETENVAVYYTENENATTDITDVNNGWTEEIQNTAAVKKYLVKIPELEQEQQATVKYTAVLPANLTYNLVAEQSDTIEYTNEQESRIKTVNTQPLQLTTGQAAEIKTTLTSEIGGVQKNTVKNGEIIRYKVDVQNVGTKSAENVKVTCPVPEGTVLIEQKEIMLGMGENPQSTEYSELIDELPFNKKETQKQVEFTIDLLEAKGSTQKYYDVLVLDTVAEGQKITNKVTTKYGEETKETNEIATAVEKGELKVRVASSDEDSKNIVMGETYSYSIFVYNGTNQTKKDVTVELKVDEELIKIISWMDDEAETYTSDTTIKQFVIPEIPANTYKIYTIQFEAKKFTNPTERNSYIVAKVVDNQKEYYSNQKDFNVNSADLKVELTSATEGQIVKAGDTIEYKISIKNNTQNDISEVDIKDELVNGLSIANIIMNGKTLEETEYSISNFEDLDNKIFTKKILIQTEIKANETIEIIIKADIDGDPNIKEDTKIMNKVLVDVSENAMGEGEVYHILSPIKDIEGTTDSENPSNPQNPSDPQNPSNPQDPSNPNNPVDPSNPNNPTAGQTKVITGIAWVDEDEDGKRANAEQLLDGITVKLLDPDTSKIVKDSKGQEIVATTKNGGFYELKNVPSGKYIVIFEYDTTKYNVTSYKKENVPESQNSKAIVKTLEINGQKQTVGVTDIITVEESNITNINIGLKVAKKFDMKLEKFVKSITVSNTVENKKYDFEDSNLAKVDINKKYIDQTTIITEYVIKVTNVGDVEGYVKKIVDYLPSDYTFVSTINTGWYKEGQEVYNTLLENEKLLPGESKEVTLTVSKKMTQNNTGVIVNSAEIAESYNEKGLKDINSTAGNRNNSENDYGTAEVIVSIKTGGVLLTTTIIGMIIVMICLAVYVIKLRRRDK